MGRPFRHLLHLVCLLLIVVTGGGSTTALAQGAAQFSPTDLRVRQAQLLTVMLADPENLDIAFEYALVSTRIGDYEAAIGTLERILIYSPGLARVQLELGVLYFRLGATDVARTYFASALAGRDVPPEVEARVQTYLAAIGDAENPADFSATLVTGLRVQSNANAGPGARQVSLNGSTFVLDETSTGRKDASAFVAGNVHGAYDLGTQGDLLEADLVFYGARYKEVSRLDTALAELTVGPSINLERFEIDNARLGLYAIANGIRLNHANYSGALGAGARFALQIDPITAVNAKLEIRRRWYNDTASHPNVSGRSGHFTRGALTFTRKLSASMTARVLVFGDYEEAKVAWAQSWEVGGGIGTTYRFASPIKKLQYPWSIDVEAGYIRRLYDGPDPVVSATQAQHDHEGWGRVTLQVPFRGDLALGLTGELRRQASNYDLATYNNASAMVSLMKSF